MDKDLSDFVALGKECGLKEDALMKFANEKLVEYNNNLRDKRAADRETAKLAKEAEIEAARIAAEHELEMARVKQEAERIAKEHELELAKLSQPTVAGDVKTVKNHQNAFKFKPKPFNERLDSLDSWFDIYDRQAEFCNLSSETKKLFLYDCFHGKYSDSLLATDKNASYEDIKKSMLANFNMTANDYRKRFFDCVPEKLETFASYLQRLEHTIMFRISDQPE